MRYKRITKQVRVSAKWHEYLKREAEARHITISKLLDKACERFSGELEQNQREVRRKLAILFPKMKLMEGSKTR